MRVVASQKAAIPANGRYRQHSPSQPQPALLDQRLRVGERRGNLHNANDPSVFENGRGGISIRVPNACADVAI